MISEKKINFTIKSPEDIKNIYIIKIRLTWFKKKQQKIQNEDKIISKNLKKTPI